MGRYAEAEPLFVQAMEIRHTALGERHPDYATSLSNLADLYCMMGRFDECDAFFKQANLARRASQDKSKF